MYIIITVSKGSVVLHKFISFISIVLLLLGFGIISMYFVEINRQLSYEPREGLFHSLGIQYRYPFFLAFFAFFVAAVMEGKKSTATIIFAFIGIVILTLIFLLYCVFNMFVLMPRY